MIFTSPGEGAELVGKGERCAGVSSRIRGIDQDLAGGGSLHPDSKPRPGPKVDPPSPAQRHALGAIDTLTPQDLWGIFRSPRGQVLGLATEALTKSEETIWLPKKSTLRGPPDELFPPDRQGPPATGPRAGRGSLHLSGPFFDELPADDRAG